MMYHEQQEQLRFSKEEPRSVSLRRVMRWADAVCVRECPGIEASSEETRRSEGEGGGEPKNELNNNERRGGMACSNGKTKELKR